MARLLQTAQIKRVGIGLRHDEPDNLGVKTTASLQIGHAEHDVARTGDVKFGVINRVGYPHAAPLAASWPVISARRRLSAASVFLSVAKRIADKRRRQTKIDF